MPVRLQSEWSADDWASSFVPVKNEWVKKIKVKTDLDLSQTTMKWSAGFRRKSKHVTFGLHKRCLFIYSCFCFVRFFFLRLKRTFFFPFYCRPITFDHISTAENLQVIRYAMAYLTWKVPSKHFSRPEVNNEPKRSRQSHIRWINRMF